MSSIKFFPIRWFEDFQWKSIQVFGRLQNGRSVYIRIGFRPYLTVRYPDDSSEEEISEYHNYLLDKAPISDIVHLSEIDPDSELQVYRVYVRNRDDYNDTIDFYKSNQLGFILDGDLEIKSKFFAERKINPGSWQKASNLQTLFANLTTGSKYSSADLEYFTRNIVSLDEDIDIPQTVNAYYDIEAIPSDDVSFPDAETDQPPDSIFSISLIVQTASDVEMTVYFMTNQHLTVNWPENYTTNSTRTGKEYSLTVVTVSSEKELLEKFFEGLLAIRPDRLISMNGRRFDLNYIGVRSRALNVKIPSFTKNLSYIPYFYQKTLVQVRPFPKKEKIWTWTLPGICQIDLLDFYRRLYPQLGHHNLETLGQIILGRGKTGLSIPEMFSKYRRGTQEDYDAIIDYSIMDSILLMDLWNETKISQLLSDMSNFWKNDSELVITTAKENLFTGLIHYINPVPPFRQYSPGRTPTVERKPGIHRNVYLYTLTDVYLTFLEKLQDPLADYLVEYFQDSNDGIIPFKSGYFPVTFDSVINFVISQISNNKEISSNDENSRLVWIDENSLAVEGEKPPINPENFEHLGPYPFFQYVNFIPLVIVVNKSWILVDSYGIVFKKGLSSAVRPPFKLLQKYIDYLIEKLLESGQKETVTQNEPIVFPEISGSLDDFTLEMKVSAEDFQTERIPGVPLNLSETKLEIISQLQEIGSPVTNSWRKIKYLKTEKGPVIEEIYSKNPEKYSSELDLDWYNQTLTRVIKSITN